MPRPKSTSKRNKELPSVQNAVLTEENSHGGVWAHELAVPEIGGLVCRIPLKVEIYRRHPAVQSTLRGRLRLFLQSEEYMGADSQTMLLLTGPRSLAFTGEAAAALSLKSMSISIRLVEVPGDDNHANLPSFSALAARTVFWYHGTKRLLKAGACINYVQGKSQQQDQS